MKSRERKEFRSQETSVGRGDLVKRVRKFML